MKQTVYLAIIISSLALCEAKPSFPFLHGKRPQRQPQHHQVHHQEPVHHQVHHQEPVHHQVHHQAHHVPVHHHHATEAVNAKTPVDDVVDVAINAGSFKTLVKIVSDLGLVDTLKNAKAVTILAPSDEAFAKLPAGTLESLSPDAAKEIVLRHVIRGRVPAAAIQTGRITTFGGEVIDLIKTNTVQIGY